MDGEIVLVPAWWAPFTKEDLERALDEVQDYWLTGVFIVNCAGRVTDLGIYGIDLDCEISDSTYDIIGVILREEQRRVWKKKEICNKLAVVKQGLLIEEIKRALKAKEDWRL